MGDRQGRSGSSTTTSRSRTASSRRAEGEAPGRRGQRTRDLLDGDVPRRLTCPRRAPTRLGGCRPHLPDGEPSPRDGSLPDVGAAPGSASRPFGVYVHVPFCAMRCGYCDFNTYTATELGGGASQAAYAATAAAEVRLARRVLGDADVSGGDRLLRRRHADPAAARPTWRAAARRARRARAAPGRRGHDRGQPRQRRRASRCATARGRLHPGVASACSRRCRTCWPRSTARTTRSGCRRSSQLGARGRLRGRQPGPDLRHAGGVAGRLADQPRGRAGVRSRTTCARTPWSSRRAPAWPAQVRRGEVAGAGRRRPRRPLPARRRGAGRGAGCEWYEVSNWSHDEHAARPAQRGLLARPRLVGRRPRRAQPRRRHPVVERPPPGRVRRRASPRAPSPAQAREVLDDEQRRAERVLLGMRLREGHPLDDLSDRGRAAAREAGRRRAARRGRARRRPRSADAARPSAGGRRGPRPARLR